MEDVLGARGDPDRFSAFLSDWESVLVRRVEEAVGAFTAVEGLRGLVLAGSLGRGAQWPLSDIDLLPIYDDGQIDEAQAGIARGRAGMLGRWAGEGWWTGLDIGNLVFSRDEVDRALGTGGPDVTSLLEDDRWYHSVDKGYQGRAVYDPLGLAAELARWFTENRFIPPVVRLRLERARGEVAAAQSQLRGSRDPLEGTKAARLLVKWTTIWLLESWGERDNSLGRLGTRFERLALLRGQNEVVHALNALSGLDDASAERRMGAAPAWVWERHDRSWRARWRIGEEVSRAQDARDVLRVCAHYEMRKVTGPPFPAWLGISASIEALAEDGIRLSAMVGL